MKEFRSIGRFTDRAVRFSALKWNLPPLVSALNADTGAILLAMGADFSEIKASCPGRAVEVAARASQSPDGGPARLGKGDGRKRSRENAGVRGGASEK